MGKLRGHGQRHDGVDDGEYGEGEREGMRPPGSRGQQVVRSSGGAMAAAVAGGGGGHHGQDGAYDDRGFGVAGATAGQHGTDSVPNEGRPGQEAFRTRRPSFMDRFRGRGKRDVEDDDYSSRSGSPSPPPSRGQQRMRGPAGAAVTGQYNAEDVHGDQRAGGTESRPGQEAFRTRRPSFIDRLRGRGKRDLDDDDYSSRSGSPSPPPGRGQQQMRGSAGAAAAGQFDAEGAHGDPRIVGNESRPGQEAFRARRPSLMDRLRGRGKRELDEDDYSSQSGSPSPPPGRGQPDHMGGSEPAAMAGAQREPYAYANDRMEEGDRLPFKARRPSLMDRLRGRSKRGEVGEDGYSRSPTPSPPPSSRRQQQQLPQHIRGPADAAMGGGAQRAAYQQPQTQAGRRIASDMQYVPPTQAARNKGYNLASPPVGSAPQPVARAGPGAAAAGGNNNPYPQSGIRHSSAPLSKPLQMQPGRQQPLANEPWRHDEQMSEGSFTGSDEYVDEKEVEGRRRQSTQVRRASKAERFFGIGDEGGSWGGNGNGGGRAGKVRDEREEFEDGDEAGAGMGKKKAGWKVWK